MKLRYPVYVPSKSRHASCITPRYLERDGCPFYLVVEPSEEKAYRERMPNATILVMPRDDMKLLGVRNWIRDHSIANGFDRHWQLDDNIRGFRRLYRGKRIPCNSIVALGVCEEFTDRYTNIGISGLTYTMFVPNDTPTPYYLNCHVYSCSLINNRMPYKWRLIYNDDTDICLQVLSAGLCTVAINCFSCDKARTMLVSGGNTNQLYEGDGRLRMSRSLERVWPYVVETRRKFKRPQHHIKKSWAGFDQKLIRRADLDWSKIESGPNEFGIQLVQKAEIESQELRQLYGDWGKTDGHGKESQNERREP